MIKLSKNNWNILAEWIVKNTCGCVYGNFKGVDLKQSIEKDLLTKQDTKTKQKEDD